jgi:ABC-type sugar transport system ATPase subunit
MTDQTTHLLEAEGLGKTFGHVVACRDVSFALRRGEILVILGDNGAGKSTLIKMLSGMYSRDSGTLRLDGQPVDFNRPRDATTAGISTVYQDLALVDPRDIAENLFLGHEFTWGPFMNRRRARREAERILRELDVKIPSVRVPVGLLSGGQRQAVAVARTLVHGAKVIIMDEPTAALGVSESAKVMRLARDLRDSGKGVIIISHNLEEVWDVADRFLVMRLGGVAGICEQAATSVPELVQLIVYGSETPATGAGSVEGQA